MGWRRAIAWMFLICELVALACLFLMLLTAGFSAGFVWWPMPITLGISLLLTAGCVFFARKHGRIERGVLWGLSLTSAAYFSYVVTYDSWQMSHPVNETWVIPDSYHGPIHVIRGVSRGAVATQSKGHMVFVLDQDGIAAVKESPDSGWVHTTYLYRHEDGTTSPIPEPGPGSPGVIDDTPENRRDKTRRIYFPSYGETADGSACFYKMNQAYLESPSEALEERSSLNQEGQEQDKFLEELKRRYQGGCSTKK